MLTLATLDSNWEGAKPMICLAFRQAQTLDDMKSDVVIVAIVLIWDFIFMFLGFDLVLYILGYYTFYMLHYLG